MFAKETEILMSDYSVKSMKQVQQDKFQDQRVLSFDPKRGTIEFASIMAFEMAATPLKVLSLEINGGDRLICTEEQQLYRDNLDRIRADDVKVGMRFHGLKLNQGREYVVTDIQRIDIRILPMRIVTVRYARLYLKNGLLVRTF